jgi:uncharacterized protein (DUF4415 family)
MPDLTKQTPRQRAQMTYMMDVMRRLEWDLHNTIELTGRIPEAWHQIATATPRSAKVKVTLDLERDVVKFFKSMGEGYGPRINDVLRSYMHARLAGVIRGAETLALYREREEAWSGEKPQFGEVARAMGEAWDDEGPGVVEVVRAQVQKAAQKAGSGPPGGRFDLSRAELRWEGGTMKCFVQRLLRPPGRVRSSCSAGESGQAPTYGVGEGWSRCPPPPSPPHRGGGEARGGWGSGLVRNECAPYGFG